MLRAVAAWFCGNRCASWRRHGVMEGKDAADTMRAIRRGRKSGKIRNRAISLLSIIVIRAMDLMNRGASPVVWYPAGKRRGALKNDAECGDILVAYTSNYMFVNTQGQLTIRAARCCRNRARIATFRCSDGSDYSCLVGTKCPRNSKYSQYLI